jgi:hypothetical protein
MDEKHRPSRTNAKDALKVKWGAIPFALIHEDLDARANKRVVRADDAWLALPAGSQQFFSAVGRDQGVA